MRWVDVLSVAVAGLVAVLVDGCASQCDGGSGAIGGHDGAADMGAADVAGPSDAVGNGGTGDAQPGGIDVPSRLEDSPVAQPEVSSGDVPDTPHPSDATSMPDFAANYAPDGVCPPADPSVPKPGDPCEVEGASRCSEGGRVPVDLFEWPKQYLCARPYRLVCTQTAAGLVWDEVACPLPPESCNRNRAVTCVEQDGGTRCCPTRCRKNPAGGFGAGDPVNGTLLCSDLETELCQAFPWMSSTWLYGCGKLEETKFANAHTDCQPWCGGCTYYYPATRCPAVYYCNKNCGHHDLECVVAEDGSGSCPDPETVECVESNCDATP